MIGKLRQIPPVGWIALAALAGVVFLCWHAYARDDTDGDWTRPKETQAPPVAPFPLVPAQHGTGAPMACNPGFKARGYAPTLVDADVSIIGDF
jgi:hypothetical protein